MRRATEQVLAEGDGTGLGVEDQLTPEEQREVQRLKQRDTEVRRHEQAHVAAGGQYVRGGANFEYTTGPDGRRYATGGEVSIDVSAARTPEATIQKMQVVRRAALAPAEPSAQDRRVAAQASQKEAQARQELARAEREGESGDDGGVGEVGSASQPGAPKEPREGAAPATVSRAVTEAVGASVTGSRFDVSV